MNAVYGTYEDISDCWPIFKQNLDEFLPLKNVQRGRNSENNEMNIIFRSFPSINLKLIPFKAEILTQKSLLNINERPYLHIFIGYCEDIDVYRQQFRPKLKKWLESVPSRKSQQFIVIIIENQDSVYDSSKNNKTFLLDKIRFDFSDRVALKLVSLRLLPGDILNLFSDCVEIISDCVYQSALMNLNQLDEDIKKLSLQRNLPGWNFCTFFLTKESKAISLFDLGLYAESLVCYDELEAFFIEMQLKNQNSTDNDYSILNLESKLPKNNKVDGADVIISDLTGFRELIYHNQISSYELIIYIFSKQVSVLLEMKDLIGILNRSKYFICTTSILDTLDEKIRRHWIFDAVITILKLIKPQVLLIEKNGQISNLIADLLILANNQIEYTPSDSNDVSFLTNSFDILHVKNLADLISTKKIAQFRVMSTKYCLNDLNNSPFKKTILMLKLADLYLEIKLYNASLEILQEISALADSFKWSSLQIIVLDKSGYCYWNLKMPREFLRKMFNLLEISNYKEASNQIQIDRIIKATAQLDDILTFDFDCFFKIEEIRQIESSKDFILIQLQMIEKISLPFDNYEISIILSGEKKDINLNAAQININDIKIIIADFKIQGNYSSGIYKLRSVSINFGKLAFCTETQSNAWARDIILKPLEILDIKAILPETFDFVDPHFWIQCKCNEIGGLNNVKLVALAADLNLIPHIDQNCDVLHIKDNSFYFDNLQYGSCTKLKYSIENFIPENHKVQVIINFSYKDNSIGISTYWIELNLPKPWIVQNNFLDDEYIKLCSVKLKPEFISNSSLKTTMIRNIETISDYEHDQFNFEIKRSDNINYVLQSFSNSDSENIKISYLEPDNIENSFKLPILSKIQYSIFCTCLPQLGSRNLVLGIPVKFDVSLKGNGMNENINYSICYDPSYWLLIGSSKGISKSFWNFSMVPIRSGVVQLPTIALTTMTVNAHVLTEGMTVFISDY